MLVNFKNTGMVEEADIRFDGLTVIAGENDTGKSTVGKLMFAVIKTFTRYEKDARAYRVRKIRDFIEHYYFDSRKKYTRSEILDAIETFFNRLKDEMLNLLESPGPKDQIQALVSDKITSFTEMVDRISGFEINLEDITAAIVPLIADLPEKEFIFKRTLSNYLVSIFSSEVAGKFAKKREYAITGKESDNILFEISGTNEPVSVQLKQPLYFEDAVFIESPVLLNLADIIRFAKTRFDMNGDSGKLAELLEKPYVPEYMKDLILKITQPVLNKKIPKIVKDIGSIIKGDFYYDHKENDFVFEKRNETFKGLSVSPGIKFLGAVGLLVRTGYVNKRSLLIIDEPESHIHPHWQVKFAEVLVKLVQQGNNILLTSHSPYFLEAVKLYSDQYLEKGRTAFYLSKEIPGRQMAGISNVTHDISPIFEVLAEPFRELERFHAKDIT